MIPRLEQQRDPTIRAMAAIVTVAVLGLFGATQVRAETADPPVSLFDQSRLEGEPLALQIRAPWHRLRRETEDKGPYPATLTGDGLDAPLQLTVEKRGISRLKICAMPPIRLRLEKDPADGTLFEGNRAIKVVTHCRSGNRWEQYVVREFLAYRFYSALTELSFRVRPVTIRYEDSERDEVDGPRVAFLIEDDRLVANRHGLDKVDVDEIPASRLPAFETSVFMLFQFMIGNVDFSPLGGVGDECCHNVKLIGNEETLNPLYAVPYDFDSSGWVDTSYAVAPEQLPIEDVRQRLFRGFCRHNDGLPAARELFQSLRAELYRILESESRLTPGNARKATRYLDDFFEILDSDRRFERMITSACRS